VGDYSGIGYSLGNRDLDAGSEVAAGASVHLIGGFEGLVGRVAGGFEPSNPTGLLVAGRAATGVLPSIALRQYGPIPNRSCDHPSLIFYQLRPTLQPPDTPH
jgi:hypothetical protein